MGSVRPILNVAITQRSKREESPEALYWRNVLKVGSGHILKEFSPINHIDIRDADNQMLVCSGTRLSLYGSFGGDAVKTYSAPKVRQLFHSNFRYTDQRLLAAGTNDGRVFVWDVNATRALRVLGEQEKNSETGAQERHKGSVRFVTFCNGGGEVISAADDGYVRLWDLGCGAMLRTLGKHNDYVRSGVGCYESGLIATGGYDHVIKLWDTRASETVCEWKVSAPVYSLACNRTLLYAASGNSLHSYDLVAGRAIVEAREIHSKQLTSVATHNRSVITCALDGQLRVWDLNLRPLHRVSFAPAQLLSIGCGAKLLAIGTTDGQVHAKSLELKSETPAQTLAKQQEEEKTVKQSIRSKRLKRLQGNDLVGIESFPSGTTVVRKDANRPSFGLRTYEKLLLEFRFSDALDAALNECKANPVILVSMFQELIRRQALHVALAGRSDSQLKRIIQFICRHITDSRLSRPLIDTSMALTELYTSQTATNQSLATAFRRLHSLIGNEINRLEQLSSLQGQINLIVANMST